MLMNKEVEEGRQKKKEDEEIVHKNDFLHTVK